MTSSCDGFKITNTGSGCYGALPHTGIDPFNVGVHLYLAFQELIVCEVPPKELVSLTFGQFPSRNSCNIIPQDAILQGTLHTYNDDIRKNLLLESMRSQMLLLQCFTLKSHMKHFQPFPPPIQIPNFSRN